MTWQTLECSQTFSNELFVILQVTQSTCKSTSVQQTHRQQSLNILLQKGGDVLPVQYVDEPAVLSLSHQLMTTQASRVGRVLEMEYLMRMTF